MTLIKKKEPIYGAKYFYIENGMVFFGIWSDTDYDRKRVEKMGWFRTKEAAQKRADQLISSILEQKIIRKNAWVILKGDKIMDIYLYKETLEEFLKSPAGIFASNLGTAKFKIKECIISYEK